MQPTRNPHPLSHIGDEVTDTVGRTHIRLAWTADGQYTVTTTIGGVEVPEHTKTWPTEEEARSHAYMLAHHYRLPDNYQWPCGCGDRGWIDLGNEVTAPCGSCNPDGTQPEGGC